MKKIITIIYILLIITVSPQISSGSLRCNGKLICTGDYTYVVFKKCGKPCYKEIIRIGIKRQPKIEHWVYERYGLIYYLVFQDGKLIKVESIWK
ncbi:MAG: DUF2845 domain-containing protein [Deltaproteobacteria bacterium]|nr:DUF2845 domain-containing protein [Deltaproteobacteria bacterium]